MRFSGIASLLLMSPCKSPDKIHSCDRAIVPVFLLVQCVDMHVLYSHAVEDYHNAALPTM